MQEIYRKKALKHLERAKECRQEELGLRNRLVICVDRADYMHMLDEINMTRLLRITHLRKTHEFLKAHFRGQIFSEDAAELEKAKIARDYSGG